MLKMLDQHRCNIADTRQLSEWFEELDLKDSPWKKNVKALLESWQQETSGSELPVTAFKAYVLDYLREAGREQRLGKGIHLGTVHSAKGMEFKVVCLLDGGWDIRSQQNQEEERRLFYVGMTRAMDSLVIFQRNDCRNPHIPLLSDGAEESICARSIKPAGDYILKQYQILGMRDLYLSYAGRLPENHPVHALLQQLNVGDELTLKHDDKGCKLLFLNQAVAALSRTGSQKLLQPSSEFLLHTFWLWFIGTPMIQRRCIRTT